MAQHEWTTAGPSPDPDAPHEEPNLSYIPALDGVRAFAVLGVMAFHGGIPWLVGGYLGVDTFFVLSGFLITSLLLNEWQRLQTIRLGAFWARRARRLLPALLLVLLFVACYAAFAVPRGTYPDLRLDALSTLFYVANWHFILIGSNYFNQAGLPSPLTHTWSLAIEEQFYLVWPLVVLAVLKLTRNLRVLLAVCVVGAAASATEMALLYHPGANTTRLYYGTDTHAQSLLVGAGLAVALSLVARERSRRRTGAAPRPARGGRAPGGDPGWAATTPAGRVALTVVGLAGVAGCAVLWNRLDGSSGLLYQGGFLLAALATAAVLVSVVCAQRSPVALALSVAPLRYLGRISYGMYLWHYPLFIWIDGTRTGLAGYALFGVRAAATIAVATVSFYLVERPVRQGGFLHQWRAWVVTPVAVVGVAAALVAATTVPAVAQVAPARPSSPSSLYRGPAVKVLLIGDSTAVTLGEALSEDAKTFDVTTSDKGILGCGVLEGTLVKTTGVVGNITNPCNSGPLPPGTPPLLSYTVDGIRVEAPDAERWTVWYTHWIDTLDPDVVMVLAGRWEVKTRTYQGQWTNILHPTFAAYVKRQLQHTVRLASAKGARVVLLTAPCYDHGEQPDGQPWPTDTPQRLDAYNRLVREVAAEDPATVSLLDLDAMVCPGGQYQEFIDGMQIRNSDGIHFVPTGGPYLGPKIWPAVVKVGREQMAARHTAGKAGRSSG